MAGRSDEGVQLLRRALVEIEPWEPYRHAPVKARLRSVTGLCALQAGDRPQAEELARQARTAFTAQPEVAAYFKAPLVRREMKLGIRGNGAPAPVLPAQPSQTS